MLPSGITDYGGSVIGDDAYIVRWVAGPEGSMFWLEQVTLIGTGGIQELRVTDVVLFPPLEQDVSDVVVTGTSQCELDGTPVTGVVGIFPYSGEQWLVDPYAAWWADLVSGTLVALPGTTRCVDEGAGA